MADADAERRGDELRPRHPPARVSVEGVDHLLHLQRRQATSLEHNAHGLGAKRTPVLHVEVRKDEAELAQSRHRDLMSDEEEHRLLELRLAGIGLQTLRDSYGEGRRRLFEGREPGMLEALGGVWPLVGVLLEHAPEQVHTLRGDGAVRQAAVWPHAVLLDRPAHLRLPPVHVLALRQRPGGHEGEVTGDHVVQDDRGTPDITLLDDLQLKHFGSHV
mmetsp:Transcript_97468/g.252229  ORF Transcript_97468/g.252229 Transcript_97468/m.252229 type:complete len:217 (-) Transcript_97468:1371-2021(-)